MEAKIVFITGASSGIGEGWHPSKRDGVANRDEKGGHQGDGEKQRHVAANAGLDGGALLADLRPDAVEVEVDVHPVGDRLGVGVLADQVLGEEGERLLAGGGGEADDVGVEVLQHAAPHPVDRAVRLVDEDHDRLVSVEHTKRLIGVVARYMGHSRIGIVGVSVLLDHGEDQPRQGAIPPAVQ